MTSIEASTKGKGLRLTRFLASRWGLILTGSVIGLLAALLQRFGNPANMGLCIAGFIRDITGALGFQREAAVQYLRPEIAGLLLGATLAALLFQEFKSRASSASLLNFVLGGFAMIGALVFQGCSLRALLRLVGGDLNAIPGLVGFAGGVWVGLWFIKRGFSLGKAQKAAAGAAWIAPAAMGGLIVLIITKPQFSPGGPIFSSVVGVGSLHAAVWISLAAGLVIGFLAQRSRFCTMGAVRDVLLMRETTLLGGVISLALAAFVANLVFGQVKVGFTDQPAAQGALVWNFLGMLLVGLASALAGGCPTRQIMLAGEGSSDAAIFLLGMGSGAVVAHNFNLVKPCVSGALPVTVLPGGMIAVGVGLVVCLGLGLWGTLNDVK